MEAVIHGTKSVYAIATMDTKGHELAFVAERLRAAGVAVVTVDVGTKEPAAVARMSTDRRVAGCHPTARRPRRLAAQSDRGPGDHRHEPGAGMLPAPRAHRPVVSRRDRDRRQRRHGPDHARHARPARRPAQADGLDGRQRQHGRPTSARATS